MGVFGGLDQDKYDRQYSDSYLFRRLADYFQGQARRVVILSVMGLGVSVALALVPIIIAEGIDALQTDAGTGWLALLIGALLVTVVVQYAGNWLRRRMTNRIVADLTADMRKDAFKAAVERDMAFYDENKTGKVLSRITSDTDVFGQVLIFSADIVSRVVEVIILAVVLLNRNVLLTLILLGFTLPMVLATSYFRRLARRVTRQGSRAMAAVNDNIQETVTGITVAKNFRQERMIYDEFVSVNEQSYAINMRRGVVLALVFPVLNALAGVATGAIVFFGARQVVDGALSVSIWYLYIQAVDRFWFPLINIASYWSQFQQAMSSLERIFALIDAENVVQQQDAVVPGEDLAGQIAFENVVFEYTPGARVLDHFGLTIQPGENIAFVGHTGAGKSTLAKLIMRFYEFQGGAIRVDGHDIRSFDLQAYRSRLGFVPQQPFLFSGTIKDNIRYGRPDATDAEIEAIAYSIGNGEWMETLPEGLQSDVGERGARLSIGQRQLVSLLRVLVQRPAVFILDEATASVDNFTELQIQEALELILARSTSILIAHRLSTVRSADRIIVLREGSIIEEGNHGALIEQGGHYAELYNTYFRHQSLSYVENARALLADDAAAR
ncbi:MAG: ABC transporter ATP-binding protein [Chloroflexi bacterium]|nr:ABC transporter ATP-binding protein [Chloroflexota bacterium]